jgi:hypothetical protein
MRIFGRLLSIALLIVLVDCSNNPFFGDEVIEDGLVLSGRITLQEETDYSNIFVWLRGLNVSTKTKADGSFSLQLPNPQSWPGGAFAWMGELPLYFYMDNFVIDSVMISFLNGKLGSEQANITEKGTLKKNRELKKIMHINASIQPANIKANQDQKIMVNCEIVPLSNNFQVITYLYKPDPKTPVYLLRAFGIFNEEDPLGTFEKHIINPAIKNTFNLTNSFSGSDSVVVNLPPGNYKAVALAHLEQPEIPKELFYKIGEVPNEFTKNFLKIPSVFESSTLKVK